MSAPDTPGLFSSRIARVGRTGLTTGLAKAVVLVGVLTTVPLVEQRLGTERLGVWLTLVTFSSLLSFADLGLGNGVMTRVATSTGQQRDTDARVAIANGLAVLAVTGTLLVVAALTLSSQLTLSKWFGIGAASNGGDVSAAVTIFVVLLGLGLPLAVVEKVQWGLQKGYVASSWLLAGAVTTITSLFVILQSGGELRHLAIAFAGIPVLFALANTVWSFRGPIRHLRPSRGDLSMRESARLLRVGSMYFVLQLVAALAFSTDNLIVAKYLGAAAVPGLAIPARIFGLVSFSMNLFLMPLWPEYAHALGADDGAWARRTLLRVFRIAGLVALVLTIAIAGLAIVAVPLLGNTPAPTVGLLLGLGLSTISMVLGTTLSVFFNAVGALRFQIQASLVMVVLVLALKIALVPGGGIEGVVWGGVIGYALTIGPAFAWYAPRVLRRLRNNPQ